MPIPETILAFVYAVNAGPVTEALSKGYPALWGTQLRSAMAGTRSRGPGHRPPLDLEGIGATLERELQATPPKVRAAVLFAVDLRPDDVERLDLELRYRLPHLEVVSVKSKGDLTRELKPHLEYFGLLPSAEPTSVRAALDLIRERFPEIRVLPRAVRSADDAGAFREPRLVLGSLHALKRVRLDWEEAKRLHPKKVRNRFLRMPRRDALRALVGHASFDASDAARKAKTARTWSCEDDQKRYFGWHLKWSLAGPRAIENHCRVHWSDEANENSPRGVLYIGHCGEHLD